jgi:hypothetical protein
MYDYLLGGHHNFAADRAAAEAASNHFPDLPLILRANRAFLRRAVTFVSEQGVDQFLDLGSGIPTVGNVHEVAQDLNPAARVVYVDIDSVAVTHSATLLESNPQATVLQADIRAPETILAHPEVQRLLDLDRPLAILLVAVLHFLPDTAEAQRLVAALRERMASGSYLVISHASIEGLGREQRGRAEAEYARSGNPMTMRTRDEIAAFFEGLELVEPGLVPVPLWRPEGPDDLLLDEPGRSNGFVGVGRKP